MTLHKIVMKKNWNVCSFFRTYTRSSVTMSVAIESVVMISILCEVQIHFVS